MKRSTLLKKITIFFVCFALAFSGFVLSAQTIHQLEQQQSSLQQDSGTTSSIIIPQEFLNDAKVYRPFAINPVLKNANNVSVGDIINLQFFEDKNYTAIVSRAATDINGNFTLSLKLTDYPMAFGFITTDKEGRSLFSVSIPELNQTFSSRNSQNSQTKFLLELKDNIEINSRDDVRIPRPVPILNNEKEQPIRKQTPEKSPHPCSPNPNLTGTDPATINLLVVYTPAAEAWASSSEGSIANTIAGAMAHTTAVLDNLNNGDEMILVHSQQVNYTEFAGGHDMARDLYRLTDPHDGYMDEVHQLRVQHNADIVVLLTLANDYGGIAWVINDTRIGLYDYAFNITRVQQASWTYTFIHEIGHNMAMSHEVENASWSVFPYSYGWHWMGNDDTRYGSVMSYTGARCPYFSDPNSMFMGQSTGTTTADNARTFREIKHITAFYKEISNHFLPDAPTNIVVSEPIDHGATFSWDSVVGAEEYRVIYDGSYYTMTNTSIAIDWAGWFSPCNTYTVIVQARNSCGGVSSTPVTFRTRCPDDPPVSIFPSETSEINSLKAWMQNGNLHVNGLSVGQRWAIYNMLGTMIYQGVVDSDILKITLPIRGTYVIQSGNKSIKVVY
jgi:hypothetical protein